MSIKGNSAGFAGERVSLAFLLNGLVKAGYLSQGDVDQVTARQRSKEEIQFHPIDYVTSMNLVNRLSGKPLRLEQVLQWVADQYQLPAYFFDPLKIDAGRITTVMSFAFAKRNRILAVAVNEHDIVIACAEPANREWVADVEHINRKKVRCVLASAAEIDRYTVEFYNLASSVTGASSSGERESRNLSNLEQLLQLGGGEDKHDANDQHIVKIVDWLLQYAFQQRASDIHIEPRRDIGNIRFRIDGVLYSIYQLPPQVISAVVSRIKILGRMNVAEKRRPQDGRLKTVNPEGDEIELRLATLPTAFGEKLVMRIFNPGILLQSFESMGLIKEDLRRWQGMTARPNGIVLVTGPTGSGKTTTLYSTLKQLATDQVNVCTIEDPIEMVEGSFNQMQVQHNIDLDFAAGVRALMRQDPDIIMIGEIRDLETAEMAVQAALTGHLVLSTLHTNDAPSAITRLLELGIPAYLLRATILGVMAQRLVRILCPHCKEAVPMDAKQWQDLVKPWRAEMPSQMYQACGCLECRNTGYVGREGIFEVMTLDETLSEVITDQCDIAGLRRQSMQRGMRPLRICGAQKVAAGETTLDEVFRVAPTGV